MATFLNGLLRCPLAWGMLEGASRGKVIPKHILLKSEHTVVAFRKSVKPSPFFPTTHSRFRSSPLAFFSGATRGSPSKKSLSHCGGSALPIKLFLHCSYSLHCYFNNTVKILSVDVRYYLRPIPSFKNLRSDHTNRLSCLTS